MDRAWVWDMPARSLARVVRSLADLPPPHHPRLFIAVCTPHRTAFETSKPHPPPHLAPHASPRPTSPHRRLELNNAEIAQATASRMSIQSSVAQLQTSLGSASFRTSSGSVFSPLTFVVVSVISGFSYLYFRTGTTPDDVKTEVYERIGKETSRLSEKILEDENLVSEGAAVKVGDGGPKVGDGGGAEGPVAEGSAGGAARGGRGLCR